MPKDQLIKKSLPEMMTRPVYEIMLIAWIESRATMSNSFKVSTSIIAFMKHYNIPEEYWSYDSAMAFYYNNLNASNSMKFLVLEKKVGTFKSI